MAHVLIDSHQDWMVDVERITSLVLQLGYVFVRVKRHDTIVVITGRDKHRWISLSLYILQWRPLYQKVVRSLLIGVTILSLPEMTASELVEPEHVGDWNLRDGACE